MKKTDNCIKEAASNVTVENKPLNKQELLLVKQALLEKEQSFLKNICDMVRENDKRDKRK